MKNKLKGTSVVVLCLILLAFSVSAILAFYNKIAAAVAFGIALILLILLMIFKNKIKQKYFNSVSKAAFAMGGREVSALDSATFPVMVLTETGEISWCNKAFSNTVCSSERVVGKRAGDLFDNVTLDKLTKLGSTETVLGDKIFKAFSVGSDFRVIYFVDQTELKRTASEYKFSRPVVAMLEIDSLEEMLKDENGSRRAQVIGDIQELIENWFSCTGGIVRNVSESRFFLVFEERYLRKFEEEKFDILEKVRAYEFRQTNSLTLSVGVGYGSKSLKECEILARQMLEMALSRGGDQAAVKSPDTEYRFYGGVKAAGEKGSRVRSRITANSLKKLINASSHVIVMGHKFSDPDSLGSALGIAAIVRSLDTPVSIAVDKKTSMAKSLIDFCDENGLADLFTEPGKVLSGIDQNTLLILTDTHRDSFTESEELCRAVSKKVVIDHHRKSTDYVKDSLIFYNEPISSSACEIVAEFWQYIGKENIGKPYANALLAGIMLDTKNFVLGTGVRTYEAAAYLRKCGAEPVTVKKMFSDSVDTAKAKNEVVATAEIYGECAIAQNTNGENVRLVSAQAADEMLGIKGVKASFVLFGNADGVSISARSYGEINVQIIMENLGGGGHRTMAATILKNTDMHGAVYLLKSKIDEYLKDR
ncbi:MAG: DHH family phosphoesterase [Clostridiales bacterium]|nr:DHH family phosphoesterase [Candidatus Equinaster intestinalis]